MSAPCKPISWFGAVAHNEGDGLWRWDHHGIKWRWQGDKPNELRREFNGHLLLVTQMESLYAAMAFSAGFTAGIIAYG